VYPVYVYYVILCVSVEYDAFIIFKNVVSDDAPQKQTILEEQSYNNCLMCNIVV
jgi:hypothetical protein